MNVTRANKKSAPKITPQKFFKNDKISITFFHFIHPPTIVDMYTKNIKKHVCLKVPKYSSWGTFGDQKIIFRS